MAAALEHQTRSRLIRAICAEAMRNPAGPAHKCMHKCMHTACAHSKLTEQNGLALLFTVILFIFFRSGSLMDFNYRRKVNNSRFGFGLLKKKAKSKIFLFLL